jgi:hypothetical protein
MGHHSGIGPDTARLAQTLLFPGPHYERPFRARDSFNPPGQKITGVSRARRVRSRRTVKGPRLAVRAENNHPFRGGRDIFTYSPSPTPGKSPENYLHGRPGKAKVPVPRRLFPKARHPLTMRIDKG